MSTQAYGSRTGVQVVGSAPPPDAARVAAIRDGIDIHDPVAAETFGEAARVDVENALARLADAGGAELADCADMLNQAEARLQALSPSALETRRGLAGLFDSRGRRLQGFRGAFQAAQSALADIGADLSRRAQAATGGVEAIDGLHADLQARVLELDALIAAGLSRLAATPRVVLNDGADGTAPPPSAADIMEARLGQLADLRNAAVRRLPLARMMQNAGRTVPSRLAAAEAAFTAWKDHWTQELGLEGRRPRRVRPDVTGLTQSRDAVLKDISQCRAALAAANARQAEIEARRKALSRPAD